MSQFHYHIKNFKRWLKVLNYAESTVYSDPKRVKEFMNHLEKQGVNDITEIKNSHIINYYEYLKIRPNKTRGGALSQNTIISNINVIKRFTKYLRSIEGETITVNIKIDKPKTEIIILSTAEIQALYKACENNIGTELDEVLSDRDRAGLGIYYGCGLRRSEGIALNLKDIQFKESLLHVRKGKGNKERYVPMSESVKNDLKVFFRARNRLRRNINDISNKNALFLSVRGYRLCGEGMISRLKKLAKKAGINKNIGLHTLRHSIATHLLKSGMSLENISRFLGHSTLDSTQIYTHLSNDY